MESRRIGLALMPFLVKRYSHEIMEKKKKVGQKSFAFSHVSLEKVTSAQVRPTLIIDDP